jgi:hypothetical protein
MKLNTLWATLTLFTLGFTGIACGHSDPPTVSVPITTSQTTVPTQPNNTDSGGKKPADSGNKTQDTQEKPDMQVLTGPSAQVPPQAPVAVVPPAPVADSVTATAPAASETSNPKKDMLANEVNVSGTSAANAAEAAAKASTNKNGIKPPGSRLFYTSEDMARIQLYKLFVSGSYTTNDVIRDLRSDTDFNRAVLVLGDLYRLDKINGNNPMEDVKFQELGKKVGDFVLLYNKKNSTAHFYTLTEAVGAGFLVGGLVGAFFINGDEWIPDFINSKLGSTPVVIKNGLITGLGTGVGLGVSIVVARTIYEFIVPSAIYDADPLLDTP